MGFKGHFDVSVFHLEPHRSHAMGARGMDYGGHNSARFATGNCPDCDMVYRFGNGEAKACDMPVSLAPVMFDCKT